MRPLMNYYLQNRFFFLSRFVNTTLFLSTKCARVDIIECLTFLSVREVQNAFCKPRMNYYLQNRIFIYRFEFLSTQPYFYPQNMLGRHSIVCIWFLDAREVQKCILRTSSELLSTKSNSYLQNEFLSTRSYEKLSIFIYTEFSSTKGIFIYKVHGKGLCSHALLKNKITGFLDLSL